MSSSLIRWERSLGVIRSVEINLHTDISDWYSPEQSLKVHEPWPIQILVMSKDDEIVTGQEIQIKVSESQLNPDLLDETALFASDIQWKETFTCTLVSDQSSVSCDFIPEKKNFYLVEAKIVDTKGNIHRTEIRFKAGFEEPSMVPIDQLAEDVEFEFICDSAEVEVGENVQCTLENFLSNSPALVTIERSGILDKWLVRLDPKNPVIEFTVLEDYAPHFQLSVLSLSSTKATSSTTDAKFRMGSKRFAMNNPRLESIPLTISTTRESDGSRDRVELFISTADPKR